PRAPRVLPPADRAPDPQVLLPHRDLVAALAHDMPEQRGQRILPQHGARIAALGSGRSPLDRLSHSRHITLLIGGEGTLPSSSESLLSCHAGGRAPSSAGSEGVKKSRKWVATVQKIRTLQHVANPISASSSHALRRRNPAVGGRFGRGRSPPFEAYRQVFFRFQRRVPRTPSSFTPR